MIVVNDMFISFYDVCSYTCCIEIAYFPPADSVSIENIFPVVYLVQMRDLSDSYSQPTRQTCLTRILHKTAVTYQSLSYAP